MFQIGVDDNCPSVPSTMTAPIDIFTVIVPSNNSRISRARARIEVWESCPQVGDETNDLCLIDLQVSVGKSWATTMTSLQFQDRTERSCACQPWSAARAPQRFHITAALSEVLISMRRRTPGTFKVAEGSLGIDPFTLDELDGTTTQHTVVKNQKVVSIT